MTQSEKNNIKFEKLIRNMKETINAFQNKRKDLCSLLEAEIKEINQHIEVEIPLYISPLIYLQNLLWSRKHLWPFDNNSVQISNKELTLFQQKLEDEVRKAQQEKRDHQEMLKALKGEFKELVDFQER